MNSVWRRSVFSLLRRNLRPVIINKPIQDLTYNNVKITSISATFSCNTIRFKSKKQTEVNSDDEEDYVDDSSLSRDSKIMKFKTTSLRTDNILKSALGVARNKIEQIFYDSKIRLNGKKILKKSVSVKIGDEIDVIKSVSPKNPDHIHVSRVEILNITAQEDSITITTRRFKTLLIENYEIDPYKGNSNTEE